MSIRHRYDTDDESIGSEFGENEEILADILLENSDDTLLNLTFLKINDQNKSALESQFTFSNNSDIKSALKKLDGYRYISNVSVVKPGRMLKFINLNDEEFKIKTGGAIAEVNIGDNGAMIVCRSFNNRYYTLHMNENIMFQKLSTNECIIISALEIIDQENEL